MTCDNLTHSVTVAATAQVKLFPYDGKEPHIWFRLIEAQFAAALDVCNDSDEPFHLLKDALLGQFGKSK